MTAASPVRRVRILGVDIDDVTMDETIALLTAMAESGRPNHVLTVNPEFVMIAERDREFRAVIQAADLCVPDGIGIILASALLGRRLRERVTGVDTVLRMARVCRDRGLRLFLLGAAPGIAERTADILRRDNPGLQIAGTFAGSPKPEDEAEICALIAAARPHVLFVAYGPPKQDLWIARTRDRLKIPLAMGVGGTFDFITGVAQRAPVWMQRIGLEWLHRLIREPWRWRRMLTLPKFAGRVLMRRLSGTNERTGP